MSGREDDDRKWAQEWVSGDPQQAHTSRNTQECPFLDTIERKNLDFDFERVCSVTCSNVNIYACLICGKYYQGRGKGTHAYLHSISEGHHVFINMDTLRFYCLPENYMVVDASLNDIKGLIDPRFSEREIALLDTNKNLIRTLDGGFYRQGIIGMNNIKANDYFSVVLQALSRVSVLRDFFFRLEAQKPAAASSGSPDPIHARRAALSDPVLCKIGETLRKMWSPNLHKAHVSPHDLLQIISQSTKGRFQIHTQSDPSVLLSWLLGYIDKTLRTAKIFCDAKSKRTIIDLAFKGQVEITSQNTVQVKDYSLLKLEMPPIPLFTDREHEENLIPQVPLFELLSKFNGENYHGTGISYRLLSLPRYLVIQLQRFTKNNFFLEKNPTIINFPVKNLDLRDFLKDGHTDRHKATLTKYNLLANILHEGSPQPNKGVYKIHVEHKATGTWYEIQDLAIIEVLPQIVALSEAYIQVYELIVPEHK